MNSYRYEGRDQQGQLISGHFEADSEDAVASHLLGINITPITILAHHEKHKHDAAIQRQLTKKKVPLLDLIFFSRQMYTLMRAGVPILEALKGLRESTPSEKLATVIGELRDSLDAGEDLSSAMSHHPEVFLSLYISIVEVGETSGTLPESFLKLVKYLELERETRERIKAAMRYPIIVMVAIAAAMLIINIFVIPAFATAFSKFGAELPLPTQILIATSSFTVNYWYVIAALIAALPFAIRFYLSKEAGRLKWDRIKLRLPIIGSILYRATMGRFSLAMAICVKSGVPWGQAMLVVSKAVDNAHVRGHVLEMRDAIERGTTITQAATASNLFPSIVLQMIRVGEQTGSLDNLLAEVAEYYEREVEYQLKNLSASIEPILLACVGIMVLILALGVFLPMWDLSSAAMGR